MKERSSKELKKALDNINERIEYFKKYYDKKIEELETIKQTITENKEFSKKTNTLEELCKLEGTPVDFCVYSKDSNKPLWFNNSEPLKVVLFGTRMNPDDGLASYVKVGRTNIPLCGDDCIKAIRNSQTGEIIFHNDYFDQSYHLQRAQVFGTDKASKGIIYDMLSTKEFRDVMVDRDEKIRDQLINNINNKKATPSSEKPAY